jgi:hypothetical protein
MRLAQILNYAAYKAYKRNLKMENRRLHIDLREAIDRYLAKGWEVVSRDPVALKRGKGEVRLINGVLNLRSLR